MNNGNERIYATVEDLDISIDPRELPSLFPSTSWPNDNDNDNYYDDDDDNYHDDDDDDYYDDEDEDEDEDEDASILRDDISIFLDDPPSEPLGSRSSSPFAAASAYGSDFNPGELFDFTGQTPPLSDDEELQEALPELTNDPLYQTNEDLFHSTLDFGSGCLEDDDSLPPAFDEDPLIRNAYISAYLFAVCDGSTQENIKGYLDSIHETLAAMRGRTGVDIPGLDNMARTLLTAERRLRIDPNEYMIYYILCDVCWARHAPTSLYELESPSCLNPECPGLLYDVKGLTHGDLKRTPRRILPTAPITWMLQRFLLRPGKFEELQHWRMPGIDDVGEVEPMEEPEDPLDAYEDPYWCLGDITDGWRWRTVSWGLERRKVSSAVSTWGVEDVLVHEKRQRYVSLPCGLLFSINIDWCVYVLPILSDALISLLQVLTNETLAGVLYWCSLHQHPQQS